MEINLLVISLYHQIPCDVEPEIKDNKTHFTISINKPNERFNNHFKRYYNKGTTDIDIYNHEYQKLIDLSIVLKRYNLE